MRRLGRRKGTEKKSSVRCSGNSVLYYYLTGYFLVLFIPLIICCIYYSRVISVISEDDLSARKQELKHAAVLMDTMVDEFVYLGDSLAANQSVNEFKWIEDVFEYPNSYHVNQLQQSLPDMYQINQSVFDYFIFFNESEMVINKRIAYEYEDFYKLYLKKADCPSYEFWYSQMKDGMIKNGLQGTDTYLFKQQAEKEMLMYKRPLLLTNGTDSHSAVIIFVESSVIDTLMPALSGESFVMITNSQNEILYQKSSAQQFTKEQCTQLLEEAAEEFEKDVAESYSVEIDAENYLVVRLESEKSGLIYYNLISIKSLNQRKMSIVLAVVLCISSAILVGVLISIHLSRKSAISVNSILKEISKETEYYESHNDVFSRLKTTYRELTRRNFALAEAIEKQKPFMQNAFLNRLIYESYISQSEVEKVADSLQITYKEMSFCVIIFRFCAGYIDLVNKNTELMRSCAISLIEVIEHVIAESLCVNISDEQVVLIMNYSKEEVEKYREVTEEKIVRIREELPANIADKMFIYGGNLVEQLDAVHESFQNASYMFRKEREQIENSIIWYGSSAVCVPMYPPQGMDIKLTHYVATGDEKGLHDELEQLMKVYIIENNLPVYLQHMFLNELQLALFRILGTIDMEEAQYRTYYEQLEENYGSSFLEQISRTLAIYRSLCHYVSEQKEELDAGNLMPAIVAYIDTGYGDCNLSLSSVADMFEISEPYLSTVFKQVMGVNFSAYLEGVRIDKAKDLLRSTKMLVGEISEQVGYYSVNSFCRAFKRVTGSSASEYRKGMKN